MSSLRARRNVVVPVAMVAALLAVLVGALLLSSSSDDSPAGVVTSDGGGSSGTALVVREDSHRLSTAPDGKVTFVEFLDFECEGCRAAYPVIEQLRKDYAGRVTFVLRYFPLPSHTNAERSAVAVEAAAQQGKLEAMYKRMYDTQMEWGEAQESRAPVFRGFAQDLGLDMPAYDRAVADPATLARVQKDKADGEALGVQGTPSFFLNGSKIEPESYDDLKKQLDAALGA